MAIDVIILNAGLSKRMRSYSKTTPKALLDLHNGYGILDYQISTIAPHLDKIRYILLVVGYRKEMFFEHVNKYKSEIRNKIRFIINEKYSETDNAYSVFLAIRRNPDVKKLIILDGDIIFHPDLLKKLVESPYDNCILVDFETEISEEDSKVLVIDGYARKIGKDVDGNGIYCSMIKLSGEFLDLFAGELQNKKWWKTSYSAPLSELFKRHPNTLRALPTDGLPRMDIDTPEEFQEGKEFFIKYHIELADIFENK